MSNTLGSCLSLNPGDSLTSNQHGFTLTMQPDGYLVERDAEGNCVVFLPEIPETVKGHVLLARRDQVRVVESVTANQLDASLKKTGKGLLSDYGIHIPPDRRATAGRP